jgi:hypothetical protein
MSHVEGFQCPAPEVRHTYKYRNLRMAFSNMPKDAVSLSTKVRGLDMQLAHDCMST